MKIGFVTVNFNNSEITINYIDSILKSDCFDSEIVIIDNNSNISEKKILTEKIKKDIKVIFLNENIGYFSGLNKGIEHLIKNNSFDYIFISNNDITFPKSLKKSLENKDSCFKKYPVISPSIITLDGIYQNPHVKDSIPFYKEIAYDLLYANYLIYKILIFLKLKFSFLLKSKNLIIEDKNPSEIYQGYGACYILTRNFFNYYKFLDSPTFLMGEELFLTQQINKIGFNIFYDPSIRVNHIDHASLSKIPSKHFFKICKESHAIYRKRVNIFNSKKI